MDDGWNQIQFNLADFTKRAYGTNYVETLRVQVHANCRLRRIYFSDRLYSEEELPPEFKLYLPMQVRNGACIWIACLFIFSSQLHVKSHLAFFKIKPHLLFVILQKSWKCCGRMELKPQEQEDLMLYAVLPIGLFALKCVFVIVKLELLQLLYSLPVRLSL